MLTDTEELELAWNALSGQERAEGWATVALGTATARFRAGIVYPGGEETLLIGFNSDVVPKKADLPEGAGFRVEVSSEAFAPAFGRWLCLTRQNGAGRDLFVQMAADVVAAVATAGERSETSLLGLTLTRIRAWQDFMRRPRSGVLPPEEETGLAGELTVLCRLIEGGASPAGVIGAWNGPAGGLQDFQTGTLGLEVKTTLSVTGFPARISSLEQLDELAGRPVLLAAVRLCLQEDGLALPGLVERARGLMGTDSRALAMLERALLLAGYLDDVASEYVRRFHCVEIRVFDVDEAFPRLVRSAVRPEIRAAAYDIDIDLVTAAPFSLGDAMVRAGAF